jgi:hypothetical protein
VGVEEQPNGTFADWNPTVACDKYTGESGAARDHSTLSSTTAPDGH